MSKSKTPLAQALNRSQSTISQELQRHTGQRGYRHQQADRLAEQRHQVKPKAVKLTPEVKLLIDGYIEQQWNREQIADRLKHEGIVTLHHETIDQSLLEDNRPGGMLYQHLRHQNKTYRKRYGSAHNRSGIPNRVDLDERPKAANDRTRIGDWETNTLIGSQHQGTILTLDDRMSKLRLAAPLAGKRAEAVNEAMICLLTP